MGATKRVHGIASYNDADDVRTFCGAHGVTAVGPRDVLRFTRWPFQGLHEYATLRSTGITCDACIVEINRRAREIIAKRGAK